MTSGAPVERVVVSRDGAAPLLRCTVEAVRGCVTLELGSSPDGAQTTQWTQNGVPIARQTGTALRLAGLTAEDGDVYFAILTTADGEVRSQAVLVVVVPGNPLLNVSARGGVTAEKPLIVGFVVGRNPGPVANKRYLIRVVGASLRRFGVMDGLARPQATLHRGRARFCEIAGGGEQAVLALEWAPRVGAFALDEGTAELEAVIALPAGAFSLVVTSADGAAGEALAEVYEIVE